MPVNLSRFDRLAVMVTAIGGAASLFWAQAGVIELPKQCQKYEFSDATKQKEPTGWHTCEWIEIWQSENDTATGPAAAVMTSVATREGGNDYSEAKRRFLLGMLATGFAVAILYGSRWVRQGG